MTQDPFPPGAQPTPVGPAGGPSPRQPGASTNTNAVLALVFGILAYPVLPLIGGILAVIFANKAEQELREDPAQEGATYATVGKVLGWINIILSVLFILFIIFFVLAVVSVPRF